MQRNNMTPGNTKLHILSEITSSIINATVENIDNVIVKSLQLVHEYLEVERVFVYEQVDPRDPKVVLTYASTYDKKFPTEEPLLQLPFDEYEWFYKQFKKQPYFMLNDTRILPEDIPSDVSFYEVGGIKSMVSVPLLNAGKLYGFIAYDTISKYKQFNEIDIPFLQTFGNIISSAKLKIINANELSHKSEIQTLLMDVAHDMINAELADIDKIINNSLRDLAILVKADRSYIMRYDWVNETFSNLYEWVAEDEMSRIDTLQNIPLDAIQPCPEIHKRGETLYINDVRTFAENHNFRRHLEPQGVKSVIALPIIDDTECIGFLGFINTKSCYTFSENERQLLLYFAQLYINLMHKQQVETELMKKERELSHQNKLQAILMEIAQKCINIDLTKIDDIFNRSLKVIGDYIDADRAYIMDYNPVYDELNVSYEWCSPNTKPEIDNMQKLAFAPVREFMDLHMQKDMIYLPDVAAFQHNIFMKAYLLSQGVQSVISIPIMENDKLLGFVGFDSIKKKADYPINVQVLLVFFAEIVVNIKLRLRDATRLEMQNAALQNLNTELEMTAVKANAANKAKSTFLASMSHEIRTPLNSVIGFAELLSKTYLTSQQQQFSQNIIASSQTLLDLINDILDFSKIEADQLDLEIIRADLFELIEITTSVVKFPIQNKHLTLNVNVPPDMPRFAMIDPLRLKQILINLLNNAIKFTHQGSVSLSLNFERINDNTAKYTFTVSDTGIGISEEQMSKLFKAFSQVDTSTTRKYGGTGLGLVISNRLANMMGSNIEVKSEVGVGSTFSLCIQTEFYTSDRLDEKQSEDDLLLMNNAEFQRQQAEIAKYITLPDPTKRYVILIADDVSLNIHLVQAMLATIINEDRFTAIQATNGLEAVALYKTHQPDLVFMDVQMPEQDGYTATAEIREIEKKGDKHIPIIALTAGALVGEREKCLEAGMDDYISKPIEFNSFRLKVSVYLNLNEMHTNISETTHNTQNSSEQIIHFDEAEMAKNLNLNKTFIKKMLSISIPQNQRDVVTLKSAIENEDRIKIKSIAHKMKGSNASMHFKYLSSLAERLEQNTDNNIDTIKEIYDQIAEEVDYLERHYYPKDNQS